MIIAELTIEIWECVQTRRQPPRTGVGIVGIVQNIAVEQFVKAVVPGSSPGRRTILIFGLFMGN